MSRKAIALRAGAALLFIAYLSLFLVALQGAQSRSLVVSFAILAIAFASLAVGKSAWRRSKDPISTD